MIRNLKTLGLALVAVFAMSAMAASAAYAEDEGHFVGADTDGTHTTTLVTGQDKSTDRLEFTGGSTLRCTHNEFHGETLGGTGKELTLTPTFIGPCTAGAFSMTIDENNCTFRFYTAETDGGADTWKVTTAIECTAGSPGIQTTVYTSTTHVNAAPPVGNRICTITLPPQEGLEGVTVHNNTEGEHSDLTVTVNIVNSITRTQQGVCGHQHGTVSFHGSVTLEGNDENEEPVDLFVEHTQP